MRWWEVCEELGGVWRRKTDLLEGFGECAWCYVARCGGVEDLEAGAEGVEEWWWKGCVSACAAVRACWAGRPGLLGGLRGVRGRFVAVVGEVRLAEGCD